MLSEGGEALGLDPVILSQYADDLGVDIVWPSDVSKPLGYEDLLADILKFENDPGGFALYAFPWGEKGTDLERFPDGPEAWQMEIFNLIRDKMLSLEDAIARLSIRSGHGIGKSACVSILILWAMLKEDTRGVVTANSERQLRTKTWAELGKWFNMYIARDLFRLTATSLFPADKSKLLTWRIDMVPWSEHNTTAFQGLHNQGKRILIIFDEASEIPKIIWTTAQGALSDANTQIIWFAAGNPTEPSGEFFNIHQPGPYNPWIVRAIDSRSVKFTNKKELDRQIAADPEGLDSDIIKVRILGEFPKTGYTSFISRAMVLEAMDPRREVYVPEDEPVVLGVDVARLGNANSVVCPRQGRDARSRPWLTVKGHDTMQVVDLVLSAMRLYRTQLVAVDVGGVGGGVVDRLRQLGVDVIAVDFGSGATPSLGQGNREKARYYNKRAEIWGSKRDWLRGGALPNDPQLLEAMAGVKQKIMGEDVIMLERKIDAMDRMTKEGIDFDIDKADALAISMAIDTSFYTGVGIDHGHFPNGQVEGLDHNPFSDIRTFM
jgi:hypothetical protein